MATAGSIVIDLLMKTGAFETDAKRAEKRMRQLEDNFKKAGIAMASAGAVAATGLAAIVTATVNNANEIAKFSKLANASTTEFQRMAAAASTVGISQEKLADILKDVNDKVGDFLVTGGGPMKDFFEQVAPKIGLTAEAFRNLSGPQALQLYVSSMEKAGANQQELTFLMEALANDATLLLPLLKNNSQALNELATSAGNAGAIMDDKTIAAAMRLKETTDQLKFSFTGIQNEISSGLIPELDNLARELRNPETIAAARALASGIVSAFTSIVSAIRETVNFTRWLGESFAATVHGIAASDTVRLEQEIAKAESMLESWDPGERVRLFGPKGMVEYWSDEELKSEIARMKAQVEQNLTITPTIELPPVPEPIVAPAQGPGLGIVTEPKGGGGGGGKGGGAASAQNELMSEARSLYESTRTAAERYAQELDKLNRLRSAGLIDQDTYNRAVDNAKMAMDQARDALYAGLLTEEEELKQSYERRKEEILKATEITELERQDLLQRLTEDFNERMGEITGEGHWERWLESTREAMLTFDEIATNALDQFSSSFGEAFEQMIFDSESMGDAFTTLAQTMARGIINALGQMAAQWLAYQAVQLLIGKTTAAAAAGSKIAEAAASQQMAALNAYASTAAIPVVGPAAAPGAAAAALAATAPFVTAITGLVSGVVGARADGGPVTMGMPYLIGERGPEVFVPNTNGAVIPNNKLGGSPISINLIEDRRKAGTVQRREDNANELDIFVADIMADGPRSQAIQKAYGLQRQGY